MDETQISKILFQDKFTKFNFVGVFPKNRIPLTTKFPANYIINLDNYGNPGTHWIAVHINYKYISIFCSFGNNYLNDGYFLSFINYFSDKKIIYSNIQIQGISSFTCGLYCCLFILIKSRGYSYHEFLNIFNHNSLYKINDTAICEYFKNKFNFDLPII